MDASQRPPAAIVGIGARTAHGLTALQVTMAVRAHKLPVRESHLVDKRGAPIAMARLLSIGDDVVGLERFVALAGSALAQAAFPWLSDAARRSRLPAELPVVVALPADSRPGFDPRLKRHLFPALAQRSRVPIDMARSEAIFGCRGGGVAAVVRAVELLATGEVHAVVVGGIDSYFDPDVLEHLDLEMRLHGPETENGFIPGEGAAFVVLATGGWASSQRRLGRVLSAATGREPRPYGADEPCLGAGITAAVKLALERASTGPRSLGWVSTDVVNERHRVDEWTYAFARAHAFMTAEVVHDQPLLHTGDLGAASAAVMLVIAVTRWQTGCAPADTVLIATHSDGPERGAMVVCREATA